MIRMISKSLDLKFDSCIEEANLFSAATRKHGQIRNRLTVQYRQSIPTGNHPKLQIQEASLMRQPV